MRIGPHAFTGDLLLAPMAGVSERPFRLLALELGAALCPTELVSAAGLVRATSRTRKYLRHAEIERPFCLQLFGGDPDLMARAAVIAREAGADILDVNMGCPVPKVTKGGAGAALLCDPPRAAAVVRAVRAAGLPVTAKIRSGWDARHPNAIEVARALEDAGVAAIALHPRTRAQGYSGAADWERIAAVKAAVRVPVIGNGDVRSGEDARRMRTETGCDAVMIGRAALGNPWIFREISGGPPPSPEERRALVARHFRDHLAFVAEEGFRSAIPAAVRQFRKHLTWYARGLAGAAVFRARAVRIEDPAELLATIDEFFGKSQPARETGEPEIDLRGALG